MQLLSVSIGAPRTLLVGRAEQVSGIYKEAVPQPLAIGPLGLPGDFIGSKTHGGPDQAVYFYPKLDYEFWEAELGRTLPPGFIGENLVVDELLSAQVAAGDRLTIGDEASGQPPVILEITSPRIPCTTLSAHMDDPTFIERFRQAERPGFYCRVLQSGMLHAGQNVVYQLYDGERVTMLEQFLAHYQPPSSIEGLRRLVNAPLAVRTRARYQKQLDQRAQ